jgi:hypothetical protein
MAIQDAELRIVLKAVGTELLAAMNQMQAQVATSTAAIREQFTQTSTHVGTSMSAIRERVTIGLGGIQGQIRAFGTIAEVALAILGVERAISNIVRSDQEWSKEAEHLHLALGLNFNDVATLAVAAREAGAPIEQIDALIRTFGRSLNTNEKELRNVGLTVRDSTGAFLPLFTLLQGAIHTIDEYKLGTDQLVIAQRIFGRSANEETVSALRRTIENFEHARTVAQDFGLIVGRDGVIAAREFERSQADVGLAVLGVKNIIAQALRPELEAVLNNISALAHDGELQAFARDASKELFGLGEDVVGVTNFLVAHVDALKAAAAAWGIYKLSLLTSAGSTEVIGALAAIRSAIVAVQVAQGLPLLGAAISAAVPGTLAEHAAAQITSAAAAREVISANAKLVAINSEVLTSEELVAAGLGHAALSANLNAEATLALTTDLAGLGGAYTSTTISAEAFAAAETATAAEAVAAGGGIGTVGAAITAAGTAALAATPLIAALVAALIIEETTHEGWERIKGEIENAGRSAKEGFNFFANLDPTGLIPKFTIPPETARQLRVEIDHLYEQIQNAKEQGRTALAASLTETVRGKESELAVFERRDETEAYAKWLGEARSRLLTLHSEVESSTAAVKSFTTQGITSGEVYTAAVARMQKAQEQFNATEKQVEFIEGRLGIEGPPPPPPPVGKNAPLSIEDQEKVLKASFTALREEQSTELAAVEQNQAAKLRIVQDYTNRVNALSHLSAEEISRFTAVGTGPAEATRAIAQAEATHDLLRATSIQAVITQNKLLTEQEKKSAEERRHLEEVITKTREDESLRSLDIEKRTVEERRKLGQLTFEQAGAIETDIENRRLAVIEDFLTKQLALEAGGAEKLVALRQRIATLAPPELKNAPTAFQAQALKPEQRQDIAVEFQFKDTNKFFETLAQFVAATNHTADQIHAIEIKVNDEALKQQAEEIRSVFEGAFSDIATAAQKFVDALVQGNDAATTSTANLRNELKQTELNLTEISRTAGKYSQEWITAKNREIALQNQLNNAVQQQSVVQKALLDVSNEVYKQLIGQATSFVLDVIRLGALRVIANAAANQAILGEDQLHGAQRLALMVADWGLELLGYQTTQAAKTAILSKEEAVRILVSHTNLTKEQASYLLDALGYQVKEHGKTSTLLVQENVRSSTEKTGLLRRLGTWILEELGFKTKETVKTGAQIIGDQTRVASTEAAEAEKTGIETPGLLASLGRSAADAYGKIVASFASLPYGAGIAIGVAAGAAIAALILGLAGKFEQGGEAETDMLGHLHPDEHVLDPALARAVKQMVSLGSLRPGTAGITEVGPRERLMPLSKGSLVLPRGLAAEVRAGVGGTHGPAGVAPAAGAGGAGSTLPASFFPAPRPARPGASPTGATAVPADHAERLLGAKPEADGLHGSMLEMLLGLGVIPAATGILRVSEDNTLALLHRDERVLTAPEANVYSEGGRGGAGGLGGTGGSGVASPASDLTFDPSLVVRGDTGGEHRTAPVTGGPTGVDLGNAGGGTTASGTAALGGGGHPGAGAASVEHKGTVEHKHEAKSPAGFAPNQTVTGFAGGGGSGKVQDVKIVASTPTLATKEHGGEINVPKPIQTLPAGGTPTPVQGTGTQQVQVVNQVPVTFSATTTAIGLATAISLAPLGIGTIVTVGATFGTINAFLKGGEVPEDMLAKVHEKEIVLDRGLAQGFRQIIERQGRALDAPAPFTLSGPTLSPREVLRQYGFESKVSERSAQERLEHSGAYEEHHHHNETINVRAYDSEDVDRWANRHGKVFHAVTTRIAKEKQNRKPRRF